MDGEQYIAVAQGSGGALVMSHGRLLKRNQANRNRLLVFKLGKFDHTLPLADESHAQLLSLGHKANTDPVTIELGSQLYGRNCSVCHGISARGNEVVPDLRYMSEKTHDDFVAIAFGGLLSHKGMVGFYKSLKVSDIEAIHAYLDQQQKLLPERVEMSSLEKIQYWLTYWGSKPAKYFPALANTMREWML